MLIEIARMGFGDGESGGQIVVNFAIGRVHRLLPLPAKAYRHIIAIRGAGEARGAGPPPGRRMREPSASREGGGPVAWQWRGDDQRLHSLSQAR